MKKLGEIIREEREKKNLLLRQASAILEIDQAILSKIERGERKATKEQVLKFSIKYKIDEEKLMIVWLADKVYQLVSNEKQGLQALKVAAKEVKYKIKTKYED